LTDTDLLCPKYKKNFYYIFKSDILNMRTVISS